MPKLRSSKPAATVAPVVADDASTIPTVADVPAVVVADAAPVVAKPDPAAVRADRRIARDAAGIARNATNYDTTSVRDDAYRALAALAANGRDTFTLRDVYNVAAEADGKRVNPFYSGSAKATDVGAFNRLRRAGDIVATDADCTAFRFASDAAAERCRAALAKRTIA